MRGQVEVATTGGLINSIRLEPADPVACPEAVGRRARAPTGWCSGPGSWFTSVIPHLMVPELRRALVETDGRVVLVLNLDEQEGETPGFGPEDHLAALVEHAPDLKVHTVLADRTTVGDGADELARAVAAYGAELVVEDVALGDGTPRHDPARLAAAYARIFARG